MTTLRILFAGLLFIGSSCLFGQEKTDTLIVIGQIQVDTTIIHLTKKAFLDEGKIKTNQKGVSVKSYNFSMFALGNSIKCFVNDSMYNTKMREAILNKKINYRFINIEGITLIDKAGNTIKPEVDTVKVKFKYQ
jgi:hypothetical protein